MLREWIFRLGKLQVSIFSRISFLLQVTTQPMFQREKEFHQMINSTKRKQSIHSHTMGEQMGEKESNKQTCQEYTKTIRELFPHCFRIYQWSHIKL